MQIHISLQLSKKRVFSFLSIFILEIFSLSAQDPQFSQIFSDRLYLNPALAGTLECGEFNFNHHNPFPGFGKAYKTITASFDTYIDKIGGGIGVEFLKDSQGDGAINTVQFSILYSYKIKLNQNFNLNLGIEAGIIQKKINFEKLVFNNMIDPNSVNISNFSTENLNSFKKNELDFSTGIALYSKTIFAGISVFHLNSIKKYQQNSFPPKIMIYLGKKINFNKFENENNLLTLAPFVAYKQQDVEKQFFYGIFFEKNIISVAVMFNQNLKLNSFSPVLSIEIKYSKFRIAYSYEIKLTKYYSVPTHSHEISISRELLCRKK